MATFQGNVEDITGTVSDTAALTQYLQDGAWDIIHRIQIINPRMLYSFSTISEGVGDSETLGNDILLGAFNTSENTVYIEIPITQKYKAQNENSIYSATDTTPVYWRENGTVCFVPTGSDNDINIVTIDTTNIVYGGDPTGVSYFPDDYIHLIVNYAAQRVLQSKIMGYLFTDMSPLPVIPSGITLNSVSSSLPTFTAPAGLALPVVPADANVDFTDVPDLPTYITPVLFLTSAPSISDLTISVSSPTTPSVPVITSAGVSSVIEAVMTANVPTYTKPVRSAQDAFADYWILGDFGDNDPGDLSVSATVPVVPVLSSSVVSFTQTAPTYTKPAVTPDFTQVDTYIDTDEDTELAMAKIQEINSQLNEYQADIQNEQLEFNKENAAYQAELQVSIQNVQVDNQEDARTLQKYQAEVVSYQAEVNKEIQEYTQQLNRYQVELTVVYQAWVKTETDKIASYQADIQNELHKFNNENVRYQANVQAKLDKTKMDAAEAQKEGDLTFQATVQKYVFTMQKYQADIAKYSESVNAEVQEWQQNLQGDIQVWQVERQTDIQKYVADIQKETARITPEMQEYQQEIMKALQRYQTETGYDTNKYSAEVQGTIQKFQQDLASSLADFQEEAQKYSLESAKVSARNNELIGEFQINSTTYASDLQRVLQQYTTDLQNDAMVIRDYESAYNKLKTIYEQAFVPFRQQTDANKEE